MGARMGYRLSADDETRITAAMRETIRGWIRESTTRDPARVLAGVDRVELLARAGLAAIGCWLVDLRACEVDWLFGRAARELDEAGR